MSLKAIVQQLRQLPYTEMKALAGAVFNGLSGKDPTFGKTEVNLADVLSSLPEVTNEELDNEQRFLAAFFSKKRTLSIRTANGSKGPWTVSCEGGVSITSATLRGALSEFLDAQAAYTALRK
jgi:hypothetical protein